MFTPVLLLLLLLSSCTPPLPHPSGQPAHWRSQRPSLKGPEATPRKPLDEILTVRYEHGRWNNPYYDCGGGNIWMMTYTVPFFGFDHTKNAYYFK